MSKKKPKYLVETSAVRGAIGSTTEPHAEHVAEILSDGRLFTSVYIRMEFIRRWICQTIHAAIIIRQCSDAASGLGVLEQEFSSRGVKADLAAFSEVLRNVGGIGNDSKSVSEELASSAVRWLRRFDRIFSSRINNRSKCKRGGRELNVDFDSLLMDLNEFREAFMDPVSDCEVNHFLELSNEQSEACRLAAQVTAEQPKRKAKTCMTMEEFGRENKWITCSECEKIADPIIALEQSKSWTLVHLDEAFNFLCHLRSMPHKQIKSVLAVEKERNKEE